MEKIIGIGNALVDVLFAVDRDEMLQDMGLPKGSMQLVDESMMLKIREMYAGEKVHKATGGSAANTIYALANLGAATGFIGKAGEDELGDFFAKNMKKNNVDLKLLRSSLPTGIASTFISQDGQRTFATFLGAAATLHPEDLSVDMFKGYAYFYVEGYLLQDKKLIIRAMQLAKEAGLQVCLDLASYNIVAGQVDFFDQLITKYVDIVFANESEALAFTGKQPDEAVHEIAAKCSVVVLKLGGEGAIIKKGTKLIRIEAADVKKVVDTTGAGDFFAAGFMYGLICGYSLEKCAALSNILAGQVIQIVGTNLSKRRWEHIREEIAALVQP